MAPVCCATEACTEPSVRVSVQLVSGALSDRYQSGQGTQGPTRGD